MESPSAQPRHPIAVVAQRTGLSQDLLRIWERRYAAVIPSRGPGGERLYSDADVERLRLMHATSRAGRSIGQVAALSTEALSRLAAEDAAATPPRLDTAEAPRASETVDTAIEQVRALASGALATELRRAATSLGLPAFVETVAAPLMRRIGDEWHAGGLTIAQEHLATAVLRDLLVEMMRGACSAAGARRVVVATPSGERHEIGAAIAGASAAAAGWNVIYLGADLPASDIIAAARTSGAELVALSVVYPDDRSRLVDEIGQIRAALAPNARVIVGGAGADVLASSLHEIGAEVRRRIDAA